MEHLHRYENAWTPTNSSPILIPKYRFGIEVAFPFIARFDAIYSYDWPVEHQLTLEGKSSSFGSGIFGDLIREGIADGSLRSNLDPDLSMQAIINAATGTQRRLASIGRKVELEYGQSINRLFRKQSA